MSDKIIKEGGYQPTKDPPDRPPSSVIKPATDKPQGSGSGSGGGSGTDGSSGSDGSSDSDG